jgi:hypothetical protein
MDQSYSHSGVAARLLLTREPSRSVSPADAELVASSVRDPDAFTQLFEFGMSYQEQLTVNAETGMPIQFVGGTPGQAAATTVDYQVQRVTLSDIAGGTVPSF